MTRLSLLLSNTVLFCRGCIQHWETGLAALARCVQCRPVRRGAVPSRDPLALQVLQALVPAASARQVDRSFAVSLLDSREPYPPLLAAPPALSEPGGPELQRSFPWLFACPLQPLPLCGQQLVPWLSLACLPSRLRDHRHAVGSAGWPRLGPISAHRPYSFDTWRPWRQRSGPAC
jgi:hypothetical protein